MGTAMGAAMGAAVAVAVGAPAGDGIAATRPEVRDDPPTSGMNGAAPGWAGMAEL
jgi:hypothetical protein